MSLTGWLGLLGFVVSIGLASLRLWEFFAGPRIVMSFEWLHAANGSALEWFVANTGRRKAILKEVRFLTADDPDGSGHQWAPAREEHIYPSVLDAQDATRLITMVEALPTDTAPGDLRKLLRSGAVIRCEVDTLDGKRTRTWRFGVPPRQGS